MNTRIITTLLTVLALYGLNPVSAQTEHAGNTRRARRQLLENEFAGRSPLITYGLDTLSHEGFTSLKADGIKVTVLPPDTARLLYGDYAKDGAIQVWSRDLARRAADDKSYMAIYADDTLNNQLWKIDLLEHRFPKSDPLFILQDTRNERISKREFLSFLDCYTMLDFPPECGQYASGSEEDRLGVIIIISNRRKRTSFMDAREYETYMFRNNELLNFFGNDEPLILLDSVEISRREFLTLGEDSLALIGYYTGDFVKFHYRGGCPNGVVLVEKSDTRYEYDYSMMVNDVPTPLEARNYSSGYTMLTDETIGIEKFAAAWLAEHAPDRLKGVNTTTDLACIIRPDGSIKPLLVLDVEGWRNMPPETVSAVVSTAMEMVGAIPFTFSTTFFDRTYSHAVLHIKFDIQRQ